jgi:hypothetical protein
LAIRQQSKVSDGVPLAGTIYLLRCRDFLKIGYSENFTNRLQSIRAAIRFQVDVLAARAGDQEEEKEFHRDNQEYRHDVGGREWYHDTPEFRQVCDAFFRPEVLEVENLGVPFDSLETQDGGGTPPTSLIA